MLQIDVPIGLGGWDEEKEKFVLPSTHTICLEHSLVSLSKWESKWCKPFYSKKEKTAEEILDYIKMMAVTDVPPEVWNYLTRENILEVKDYIDAPMTATTFPKDPRGQTNRETITAELIYYWMISLQIPFDPCEYWHVNRLLTLVKVCTIKNAPPKKMSKGDIMRRNAAMNAERRARLNSKG